jgi:Ring finger domain
MASPGASEPLHWNYSGSLDDKDFALHGHRTVVLLTVLCILVLVTLLYLYLRWTCYSNSLSAAAATETTVATEIANHVSSGLDAGIINSIPVELHKEGENRECVICLGVFSIGEKMKVLPSCSHGFHPDCIDGWLRTQLNCPLCRASVAKKTVADLKDMV